MKKIFILSAMMLTAMVTLAKDIKTVVVTTNPEMHCESCEKKIKGNLRFEKGIKNIITDLKTKTVTIEYDADKTNAENLVEAFKKFGYEAQVVTPESQTEGKCCESSSCEQANGDCCKQE
jgi:copper chaperone CopZ